jgi:hypothetical protein
MQTSLADLQSLQADGTIQTVLIVHERSPFAMKYGEETQLRFLSHFLVGWIGAQKQNPQNRFCTEILKDLARVSPFTTLSFASETVVTGNMPKRWGWLPGTSNKADSGILTDVLSQTRSAIDRVFTKTDTCTWTNETESYTSCAVLCTIPFSLNDPRFAESSRENSLYTGITYPLASTLTVRGNGLPYPHDLAGRFRVQAARLHPVQAASVLAQSGLDQKQGATALAVPASLKQTNGNKKTRQTTK